MKQSSLVGSKRTLSTKRSSSEPLGDTKYTVPILKRRLQINGLFWYIHVAVEFENTGA